jgi:hypothetical protein
MRLHLAGKRLPLSGNGLSFRATPPGRQSLEFGDRPKPVQVHHSLTSRRAKRSGASQSPRPTGFGGCRQRNDVARRTQRVARRITFLTFFGGQEPGWLGEQAFFFAPTRPSCDATRKFMSRALFGWSTWLWMADSGSSAIGAPFACPNKGETEEASVRDRRSCNGQAQVAWIIRLQSWRDRTGENVMVLDGRRVSSRVRVKTFWRPITSIL